MAVFRKNDDFEGFMHLLASDEDYCEIDNIFYAVQKRAYEGSTLPVREWPDSPAEIMSLLENPVNRTEKYVLKIVELINIFGAVGRENPLSLHVKNSTHQFDVHFRDIQDWFAYMQTEFGAEALALAVNAYFDGQTLLHYFMMILPAHVKTLPQKQAPTDIWEDILKLLMGAGANPRLRRGGDGTCNCGGCTSHEIAVIELFRAQKELDGMNLRTAQMYNFSSVEEASVYAQRNIQVFKRCADMFARVLFERVFHFRNFDINQEFKHGPVDLETWWYMNESGYCPEFAVPVDIHKGQ